MTPPTPPATLPPVLHDLPLTLSIRVGTVDTTVGDLLGFSEGRLVTLDRAVDEPLEICVDNKVVARGELIENPSGEGLAVKVIALVDQEREKAP